MIKELTIKEANNKILRIENELECYIGLKELALNSLLAQSVDTSKEVVKGGKRVDKYINNSSISEKYDSKIDILYKEKQLLEEFVEKELKRLKKYAKVEQLIVYYKEIYTPKNKLEKTWDFIAGQVNYSKSQCKKIYSRYKNKRNI